MYLDYQGSKNRISGYESESDVLKVARDAITSQRDYLIRLHGEWLTQILFCHGVQNANYDTVSGQVTFSGQGGDFPWWPGYNVLDAVVNRMKSTLMQSSPRRDVKSMTNGEMAIEEARVAKLVADWAYEYHNIEEKEQEAADWFIKTGNVVISFYFDKTRGEVITQDEMGNDIRTGCLVPRVDAPSRWYFDPRASTWDDVRYGVRVTLQPIEWVEERYPDKVEQLPYQDTSLSSDDQLERRLLNLTQASYTNGSPQPEGRRCVMVFEMYENPCPKYPNGRHAILAGPGMSPTVVLQEWDENPYGCIPAVLITLSKFSGRLFGESPIKHLLPAQREINRRRRQIIKNCDLLGNPIIKYPLSGGTPPQMITNKVGQILPYDPQSGNGPEYMGVPVMPPHVLESERAAMEMIAYMSPVSPNDGNLAEQASSGIQLSLMEEIKRRAVMPMMRSWEMGFDRFWKLYLKLWRRFTIFPQQIQMVGHEASAISQYVQGDMISDNITIRVVPYSSLPTSRTAAFAEITELMKVGLINPADPLMMKRVWEDLGKGDMVRTWRDMTADMDLAERNLLRVMQGQLVLPRVQDNPDVHIMKFVDFMKTTEYEEMLKTDPDLENRMMNVIKLFGFAKKQQEFAIIQEAARTGMMAAMSIPMPPEAARMMTPGGGSQTPEQMQKQQAGPPKNGVTGQAESIGPGNPMGGAEPMMTQGFGNPANPYADQGGNPG